MIDFIQLHGPERDEDCGEICVGQSLFYSLVKKSVSVFVSEFLNDACLAGG